MKYATKNLLAACGFALFLLMFVVAVMVNWSAWAAPRAKFPEPVTSLVVGPHLLLAVSAYRHTGADPRYPDYPVDMLFFCPTLKQFDTMQTAIRPKQHLTYVAEAWDCDDMAQEWRTLSHRWAVENITKDAPIPLAAFVVLGKVESDSFDGRLGFSGYHAFGLVLDAEGVWWYVEPKLGYRQKVLEARYEGSIEAMKIQW